MLLDLSSLATHRLRLRLDSRRRWSRKVPDTAKCHTRRGSKDRWSWRDALTTSSRAGQRGHGKPTVDPRVVHDDVFVVSLWREPVAHLEERVVAACVRIQ